MIGSLGAQALAAVTAATAVSVAVVLALHGVSRGAGILAAQAAGAGDFARFGRIIRASLPISIVLAVAVAVCAAVFAPTAMHALLGGLPTADAAANYLVLRCVSVVAIAFSGTIGTAFSAAGDTRFGLRLLLCINAVHLPLLVVLALGWGTHHPLGIAGAGISSLCAEIAGAVYALAAARRRPRYRIFERAAFDPALALRAFRLGLPEAVYLFLVVAPEVAIVAILAPLGAHAVAAFRVLSLVSDLTWAVPGSIGEAAQIAIGQRFGAGDIPGAQRFDAGALRYGVAFASACGIAVAAAAWPIAFICTLDAGLASLAALPLAAHMLTLPLKGYAMVGIARVRAAGDTRFSMIVGIIASIIVVPGTWAAVHLMHAGLFAVPLAWITAWIFWCAATAIRLRRFDWGSAQLAA